MSEGDNNDRQSAELLLERELLLHCQSELLSEERLHEMIGRHVLTPINHRLGDYEFFHAACRNERVTEGIIRCLLQYFPNAIWATDEDGRSSLYCACNNKNVTLGIIQLLLDAAPDSVRSETNSGWTSLHRLCANEKVDEATAIQICKFLLQKHSEAVRHADNRGNLPIHYASRRRSLDFCRLLIEEYPGCERIAGALGTLPLHHACLKGSLGTVEYLYRQYPIAIHHSDVGGFYPIHRSIMGAVQRDNPDVAVEIVQFLLDCDPDVELQKHEGTSLLHFACEMNYKDSNIEAAVQIIKILFDARPDMIEEDFLMMVIEDGGSFNQRIQAFLDGELVYAHQAEDQRLMTTPDNNGRLPLHRALHNEVRLGSIKLLVKGNSSALRTFDNSFALPLHIACQHHDSVQVVRYLLSLDEAALNIVDRQGNTALHYACLGAKYETIAMLMEKYDAASVSTRNVDGKLPIDLLWESNAVEERESVEYTGSVFQLLRAYPGWFQQ